MKPTTPKTKEPKEVPFMHEWYTLDPTGKFSIVDMVAIFQAMALTLHKEAWDRLPEEARRHFIVHKRDGTSARYRANKSVDPE